MKYFARRLFHASLLLLAVSIFSFAILQLTPGDFFAPMGLNPQISSRTIAGLRSQYGLDQSLPVRYRHWLQDVLKGDLGRSFAYNSPVTPLLAVRARNTTSVNWDCNAAGVVDRDSVGHMERGTSRKMGRPSRRSDDVWTAGGPGSGRVFSAAAGGRTHGMVSYWRNGFGLRSAT